MIIQKNCGNVKRLSGKKILDGIEKIKSSKRALHLLILLLLNGGELDLEEVYEWSASVKEKLARELEQAKLVRREYRYTEDGDVYEYLIFTDKRVRTKALEKALIEWSTERKTREIEQTRSLTDIYIFKILERYGWIANLEVVKDELNLFYSSGTVESHISSLFKKRLLFRGMDVIIVPPDVRERVVNILHKNEGKLKEKMEHLKAKAIERWKEELSTEQKLAIKYLLYGDKTKGELLDLLQRAGIDEFDAQDVVDWLENLPMIGSYIDNGVKKFRVHNFCIEMVKKILLDVDVPKVQEKKRERKISRPFEFLSDDTLIDRVIEMIRSTRRELIMCYYDINLNRIEEPLKDLIRKGKRVYILYRRGSKFIERLERDLKQIRKWQYFEKFHIKDLHCKMVLKDRKELLVSSKNLTESGSRWKDTGIWTTDNDIVQRAYKYIKSLDAELAERLD